MRTATAEFYELTAPASVTTPRLARQFVTGALQATGHSGLVDNACICVSDAVTNVIQHARVPTLQVEITTRTGCAVIAVRDGDANRQPYRRQAGTDDERGRGLALVRDLSHSCGVSLVWDGLNIIGKRVWFELRDR
ncbi:anti-sigma regulatory factor (Ser/Thr protein kinase) [Streptomyces olivoverticillatus]|uniref:Anti-sigma regulatory factor (Ser/Thr protein kinase) n=1 Tax=Streptomyces olivoverticillatus TaxID=66427 RepID=A0A7W7LNM4_9ACTN|nr:ATP-binding protein [Streptomyces olivoverticillatus]MBB4892921.1 anti-sigma regulatory factor (Ser/Thr protein kinase) [Streptomyces olivoverticillatus]